VPSGTLTILGCDGSFVGPGGAGSGYLVRTAGATIWLDAGPGTFARLQQVCYPGTLDAIVLSHEHPDHWTDIESFAVWARHQNPGEPVTVLAPPGLRERSYFAHDRALEWRVVEPSECLEIRDVKLTFANTDHGPPTMAVRLDMTAAQPEGRALAFSADTGFDWSVEELGEGIGIFLCEASHLKDREGEFQHLSGRQAGLMAGSAGVGDLVITHRIPNVDAEGVALEAAEALGRAVYQAVAGATFEW
jgi:ribonuclease BN (tRNA processing enzyme)